MGVQSKTSQMFYTNARIRDGAALMQKRLREFSDDATSVENADAVTYEMRKAFLLKRELVLAWAAILQEELAALAEAVDDLSVGLVGDIP